jgi:hypothetical protein
VLPLYQSVRDLWYSLRIDPRGSKNGYLETGHTSYEAKANLTVPAPITEAFLTLFNEKR